MVATSVASGYGLPPYDLLNLTSNSTQKCLEPPTVISSFPRPMQCTCHLHPSFRWKEQSLISPHADVIHFCANNFGLFSFARLGCVSNDSRAAPPSSDSLNLRCPPRLPSNPTTNHPHCHPMKLQSRIFAFAFRVSLSVLSNVLHI